jgi:HEAT repeat protein
LKALEAVPALIATLNDDVNTYVRSAAAESLGHLGDPRSIFPLMDALHDSSSFVRRAAAIALGQLQAKEAQVALLQALDDPNFYVQRAVINAIGKLGIPDLGSVLLPFLDTDDPRIRRTVVTALRRMGTHDAVSRMVTMLEEYMRAPASARSACGEDVDPGLGRLSVSGSVSRCCYRLCKAMWGCVRWQPRRWGTLGTTARVPYWLRL